MTIIFYAMVGCPKDPDDFDKLGGIRSKVCKNRTLISSYAALGVALVAGFKLFSKKMENSEKRARVTQAMLDNKKRMREEARA